MTDIRFLHVADGDDRCAATMMLTFIMLSSMQDMTIHTHDMSMIHVCMSAIYVICHDPTSKQLPSTSNFSLKSFINSNLAHVITKS